MNTKKSHASWTRHARYLQICLNNISRKDVKAIQMLWFEFLCQTDRNYRSLPNWCQHCGHTHSLFYIYFLRFCSKCGILYKYNTILQFANTWILNIILTIPQNDIIVFYAYEQKLMLQWVIVCSMTLLCITCTCLLVLLLSVSCCILHHLWCGEIGLPFTVKQQANLVFPRYFWLILPPTCIGQ